MDPHAAASIATFFAFFVVSTLTIVLGFYALRFIKSSWYKIRLSKIDLNTYRVFATKKGKPFIFQHIENKNDLKYI